MSTETLETGTVLACQVPDGNPCCGELPVGACMLRGYGRMESTDDLQTKSKQSNKTRPHGEAG